MSGSRVGRVLFMDDEEILRQVVLKMLGAMGYEADCAAEGEETVSKYIEAMKSGNPYDVVIVDLTVHEGMGGKEAAEKIFEYNPSAKILVSSGYATNPILIDYRKYGFAGVIVKPYTADDFKSALREVLQ